MGLIVEQSRYDELVDLWLKCTEEVAADMKANFDERNTVFRMVSSGARGNWSQVQQLAGMRGLVSDPKQKLIERPIKANYREGLTVLEYFIATHGARKGLADTALRTAESGYLTRRLVDVSADVIVREADCGTRGGLKIQIAERPRTAPGWRWRPTKPPLTLVLCRVMLWLRMAPLLPPQALTWAISFWLSLWLQALLRFTAVRS